MDAAGSVAEPATTAAPPDLAGADAGSAVAWGIDGAWLVFIGAVVVFGRRLALGRGEPPWVWFRF